MQRKNKRNSSYRSGVSRSEAEPRKVLIRGLLLYCHTARLLCGISLLKQERDAGQKISGLTANFGFTLIELLVVVLIIGILAAVALPQYKMAVAKARMSNVLTMVSSVKQAQETYYLANGLYSNDFDELSLSLPGQKIGDRLISSPNAWNVDINASTIGINGADKRVSGVRIFFFHDHISHPYAGIRSCYAKMSNAQANKICQNMSGKKTPDSNNGPDTYNIYLWK